MLSPTRGVLRGLRAASLSIVGFVLALVAHAAAGGVAPGPVALLLLAGLVGLAAVLLTGGRLGPVRVGVSLTTMQVVLHEVFMRLGTTGMAHTGMADSGMAGTGMAEAGMTERSLLAATAMVDAHVAAIAVMAVLLAYGEKAVWFLAGCVRTLRWLRVGLPALPAVRGVSLGAPRMYRVRFASGGVGRRGPPSRDLFAVL